MRTETVTLTNMCMVYDDEGNVLVQDKVDKKWSGLTFPGGHIEKGESFVDSVIREVYEETGLTLEEMKKGKLANGMDDMLRVFLEEDINEFHYRREDGVWKYELK